MVFLLLTLLWMSFPNDAAGQVWRTGVQGGIPHVKVIRNVAHFGAVGDGIHDDSAAVQAALNSLPDTGGAVYLPPGTYLLRQGIRLNDGAVLRGSGATHTLLRFDLSRAADPLAAISVTRYSEGPWVSVVGGLEKASTSLVVLDPSSFSVPSYAQIDQENDPQLMYTNAEWNQPWAQRAVGEVVRIVPKQGNRLILERPLNFSYDPRRNPRVRTEGFVEGAGVEDLRVERIDSQDGFTIYFRNAASCWVGRVESANTFRSHVQVESSYECEIRDSYFHHSHDYGPGGHGYGVHLTYQTTNCLVENNIFSSLRHSMMVSVGANGNVFGYNFSREPLSEQWWGYLPNDISVHGHFAFMNLFEGNVVEHIAVGDYWGPAGPDNTFLRNCVRTEGIWVYDHSQGQEILGNSLLKGSIHVDPTVKEITLHGNLVGGSVGWDATIEDHTIPRSLYLTVRPGFFADHDWPATGGDLGDSCVNPSRARWQAGETVPPPAPRIKPGERRVKPLGEAVHEPVEPVPGKSDTSPCGLPFCQFRIKREQSHQPLPAQSPINEAITSISEVGGHDP